MSTPRPNLPDALLRQALARRAAGPSTSAELLDDVLAAVETLPQRRGWTRPLASQLRLVPILLVASLLLSALIGLALFAGGRITPPHLNGLLAYESGGDIYVGDPTTGETWAIVTGPAFEAAPVFSPDGRHIAFYRSPTRPDTGEWPTTASIPVVRADGADERTIVPAGFPGRALGAFSWTPDSGYLVVNHDIGPGPTGGLVSLFDAAGVAEPRLLTPPLPRWPGGGHPQTGGMVAPMFRPPSGDRVLSFPDYGPPAPGTSTLIETNVDGSNPTVLVDPAVVDVPFQLITGAAWSPDARWIAAVAGDRSHPWLNERVYVMNSDGDELRRLTLTPAEIGPGVHVEERVVSWSPDGSRLLIERVTAEDVSTPTAARTFAFAVIDPLTGAELNVETYTIVGRHAPPRWDALTPVPIVSWSPDGGSLLIWEGPGTRSIVIDIETGDATRLPWASDSQPSWRRTD